MGNVSICLDLSSARKILEVIGGDRRRTETRETWLWRVSERTQIHFRVIKAIWYGEGISFENAWRLKRAVKNHDNFSNIIGRLLDDRAYLQESDPEFFSEEINRIGIAIDQLRNIDR